jgi:DNA-binding NarL/FixJ family response regulator
VRSIRRDFPEARIIALTAHRAEEYLHAALDSGVDGYVVKAASAEDLLTAIRAVCRGEAYVSPEVSATLINGYLRGSRAAKATPLEMLTAREKHILEMVLSGMKNKEIAEKLFLSTRTVEKHRANFMKKLGLHNLHQVREFVKVHGTESGPNA